jgi:hypothetical protein
MLQVSLASPAAEVDPSREILPTGPAPSLSAILDQERSRPPGPAGMLDGAPNKEHNLHFEASPPGPASMANGSDQEHPSSPAAVPSAVPAPASPAQLKLGSHGVSAVAARAPSSEADPSQVVQSNSSQEQRPSPGVQPAAI